MKEQWEYHPMGNGDGVWSNQYGKVVKHWHPSVDLYYAYSPKWHGAIVHAALDSAQDMIMRGATAKEANDA